MCGGFAARVRYPFECRPTSCGSRATPCRIGRAASGACCVVNIVVRRRNIPLLVGGWSFEVAWIHFVLPLCKLYFRLSVMLAVGLGEGQPANGMMLCMYGAEEVARERVCVREGIERERGQVTEGGHSGSRVRIAKVVKCMKPWGVSEELHVFGATATATAS